MSKKSKYIYILSLSYDNSKLWLRKSEPVRTYFSNLSLLHIALEKSLEDKGWNEQRISYSTIYRTLQTRNKFVKNLAVLGVSYYTIQIEKVVLNEQDAYLGLEEKP